jgi:DNA-binding helix-hairpin-helix protein with protein kinase domain
MVLGQGGEAIVYKLGHEALKVYLEPSDPLYAGDAAAQQAARARLDEQQHKLPAFPDNLPPQVIAPQRLAYDKNGKRVIGYTMRLLEGMEVLMSYADRQYRERHGIDANAMVAIFRKLHATVTTT